jgi:hypothetical protein
MMDICVKSRKRHVVGYLISIADVEMVNDDACVMMEATGAWSLERSSL